MPQIGPLEILIVGVLALLVFGPDKLPEMARSVGKGVTQLKRMATDVRSEFDVSLRDDAGDEPAGRPPEGDEAALADADPGDAHPVDEAARPPATV